MREMYVAVVGGDDGVAFRPRGILLDADEKRHGELFEDVIVCGLKIVIGKAARTPLGSVVSW